MKIMFTSDIMLGAVCAENVDVKQAHKWRSLREEKLTELADRAITENAKYIAFLGSMFGQERIPEVVIDGLFQVVNDHKHISFIVFLNQAEYSRIRYRNNIPENLHLICIDIEDMYTDDSVAIRIKEHIAYIRLGDNDEVQVQRDKDDSYVIIGIKSGAERLPRFEATGYEDSCDKYGYSVLEWDESELGDYKEIDERKFSYQTIEVKLAPEENQKELTRKLIQAISQFPYETFIRINLTGRSAFGFMVPKDDIANQLQSRVFSVEVYDNTVMDIDEESFENDISLRSEFVRLTLQDDSLSEAERNRILSCGWNVLNGKEVSAE